MKLDRQTPLRVVWFYLGLLLMAFGYSLVIKPGLGVAPWDILHLGIQGKTGIALGLVIQLSGVAVILLNMALGIKPTVGMLLNMLSFGPILQRVLPLVPQPDSILIRWLMLGAGMMIVGLGTALYVSADLGSGPRDGMMIGLTRKLGVPVAFIKNGMDVTVALTGWWLGGPLGVGTAVVALGLGPCMQLGMAAIARLAAFSPFDGFVRPVSLKRT
jgi:uncharacterized protein